MVATTETFKARTSVYHARQVVERRRRKRKRRHFAWAMALSLLALQFLPYLLLWDEAYLRIHDTLEGIDYQNLFAAGKTFDYSAGAQLEQVMNGLPRAAVKTGWSFIALWHWLFGLYGGYIFNYVLVHLVAFFGMYLLLKDHFLKGESKEGLVLGVSLCFSWLPFFSMLGLSVAGLPLAAWAFASVGSPVLGGLGISFRPQSWWGLAIITLLPFYTDFVWAGIPVLGAASLWLCWQSWKNLRWNWPLFATIIWMAALYVAVNWQLFQLTFAPGDFISHRLEYDYFYNKPLSLWHSLKETALVFLVCHHHVGVFVSVPILLAAGLAWRQFGRHRPTTNLLAALLLLSLFYGCYNYVAWVGEGYSALIKAFKFERVIVVLPLLWLVLFALTLSQLSVRSGRLAIWFLVTQFAICALAQDEFTQNLRQLAGQPRKPSFKAFFDEKLFAKIDTYIGLPKESYRVVSLGMHPSVAQYNRFYTLDRHASLYDLHYKHQFREIMADELERSAVVKREFDQFGNRCYLYSAELGKEYDAFLCGKNNPRSICQLRLDPDALCSLGGRYLFSAVEIEQAAAAGLRLERVFEGQYWRMWVYKVEGRLLAQEH